MIRFACPQCKTVLQAAEQQGGSSIACPQCKRQMQVPKATVAPLPSSSAPPVAALAPQIDQWHIVRGGQRYGPYPLGQLQQFAGSGHLLPMDLVQQTGKEQTVVASQIPGLFPAQPAPVPAQPPQAVGPKQQPHSVAAWIAAARKRLSGVPTWGLAAGGSAALLVVFLICMGLFGGKSTKGDGGVKDSKDDQTLAGKGGNSERKFYTSDELNQMSLDEIKRVLGPPTEVYHPRRSVNVIVFIWKTGDNEFTVVTTNAAGERPNAWVEVSQYTVNRVKKSFD